MEQETTKVDESKREWVRCNDCRPIPNQEKPSQVWKKDVPDGELLVIFDRETYDGEGPQWHLSISHRVPNLISINGGVLPGRIPTWEEIKEARYKFIPENVNVAMMLPPKRFYINNHPTCMHLWEIPIRYASDLNR